jgi:MoxR-like ATPase
MEGVYQLPEAQRDRFQFKLQLTYPNADDEREILDRFDADPDLTPASIEQVVTTTEIKSVRHTVEDTFVADPVKNYLLDIVTATRDNTETEIGASPRAALDLLDATKAHAAVNGRSYVIPDDVKHLASDVLAHRLVLNTDAELSDRTAPDIIETVLDSVETPSGNIAHTPSKDS